mgnify:CR=1 FL=1
MREDFAEAVEIFASKTGVPEEKILDAIAKALKAAYKKTTKKEKIKIEIDSLNKNIKLFAIKDVVEKVEDETTQISLDKAKKIKIVKRDNFPFLWIFSKLPIV